MKNIGFILISLFSLIGLEPKLQTPAVTQISIRELNYIYADKDALSPYDFFPVRFNNLKPTRVIIALQNTFVNRLSASILQAIHQRWNTDTTSVSLDVRASASLISEFPSFKPKLSKKDMPGKGILFFRILDRIAATFPGEFIPSDHYCGYYSLECKVLNGGDGSQIFSRSMHLLLERKPTPEGQFLLTGIPGTTASFMAAMDSAVKVFFGDSAPEKIILSTDPACLFIDRETANRISHTLTFRYSKDSIFRVDSPRLLWIARKMDLQKIGKTKKKGYGIGSGIFTNVTGLDSEKERTKESRHQTIINMEDPSTDVVYGFHIPIEEISSQIVSTYVERDRYDNKNTKKDVQQADVTRQVMPGCFITKGTDTIGKFEFCKQYNKKYSGSLQYYWNGTDSATILPFPVEWSFDGAYPLLSLEGTLYGNRFNISNSKAGNQLDIWYDEVHVASFKKEVFGLSGGLVYCSETPAEALKVLAMLSSLPFGYYIQNWRAPGDPF